MEANHPEKENKKVTTGKVIRRRRKAPGFYDRVVAPVWTYILEDVLVPAMKDMVSDAVSSATDTMLFGGKREQRPRRAGKSRVNYNDIHRSKPSYQPARAEERTPYSHREERTRRPGDDIIVSTRTEAEEVIQNLYEFVDMYGQATMSDLYSMIGITPKFTDERWGWTDMSGAMSRRTREGFLLDLPPVEHLSES